MSTSLLNNYSRYPVEFIKGKGAILFDSEGNSYLDFLSGIAVTGFGHQYEDITKAAEIQLKKLWHVSNLFEASPQEDLARKLTKLSGLDSVFFCNSGTEANEAAIKFARKWGKERKEIITAKGSFHGRTMGSLSATGQNKLWDGFNPMLPGFLFVDYNNLDQIIDNINEKTCAILIEPIQGESGVIVPDEDYLVGLRKICDENNLLLILDEVQTGIGRTGKFFAYQWQDIKPDIITSAKGIANGLPLGAVICSKKIGEVIKPGDHGSTFGGNPVAIAAANIVLNLLYDGFLNEIALKGKIIKESIIEVDSELIKTIRGKGLMLGIELSIPVAKDLAKELLTNKIVVGTSGDSVIRLLPPFIISEEEIKTFIKIFNSVITKFSFSVQSSDIVNSNSK